MGSEREGKISAIQLMEETVKQNLWDAYPEVAPNVGCELRQHHSD